MRSPCTRSLTRREFLARVTRTGGTLAAAGALTSPLAVALQTARASAPAAGGVRSGDGAAPDAVVTFFDGQLWLDTSGTSVPYRPPRGALGAAPLANLTDAELRSIHRWL